MGITVQMFIHQHTDAKVLAKPGSYRPGDIVAVYNGIPTNKAELKALVGNVCAVSDRFCFFGISDMEITDPAIRLVLTKREEILGFDENLVPYTRLDRIRTKFIDYLSADPETLAKFVDRVNFHTFTKAKIVGFFKDRL